MFRTAAEPMRRKFIYPHRSVRALRIPRRRIAGAALLAAAVSALVAWRCDALLSGYMKACEWMLRLLDVPLSGSARIELFPGLVSLLIPVTEVPAAGSRPIESAVVVSILTAAGSAVYYRVPLLRNSLIFLGALLLTAGMVVVFDPAYVFDGRQFTQLWLRSQFLEWLLLPWLSSFLFVLILPSVVEGAGWVAGTLTYGVLWSAVRLVFCLGVLHFGGALLLPLLWFCFGMLADLLYVLVAYSLVVNRTAAGIWGARSSWKS